MRKFVVAMGLFVSTALSLTSGPAGWAKPADLPADERIQCPEGQVKMEHGGIDVNPVTADEPIGDMPAPAIDAFVPMLLPACIEQLVQQVSELFFTQHSAADTPDREARQLFNAAEKDRRTGDYEKARIGFQRVHLLTPTSRVGRLAIDRIIEIEEQMRNSCGETQTPDRSGDEEQSFHDMLEHSEPLGLVEVTY